MLLEKLQSSRAKEGTRKSLGQTMYKHFQDRLYAKRGENALDDIGIDRRSYGFPQLGNQ